MKDEFTKSVWAFLSSWRLVGVEDTIINLTGLRGRSGRMISAIRPVSGGSKQSKGSPMGRAVIGKSRSGEMFIFLGPFVGLLGGLGQMSRGGR